MCFVLHDIRGSARAVELIWETNGDAGEVTWSSGTFAISQGLFLQVCIKPTMLSLLFEKGREQQRSWDHLLETFTLSLQC